MILRKPYAFLIKNFKLLHLFLSLFLGFVLYKTYNLLGFFSELIKGIKNYGPFDNLSSIYIGALTYIAIILAMTFAIIVILLLRVKKKPTLYYYSLTAVYVVVILVLLYASSILSNIQFQTYDTRTLKLAHDIILAALATQIFFLIVATLRAVGLNLGKKFNFKKDLAELDIEASDNEEFELNLNLDTEEVKSNLRKRLRMFKYIYKENKAVFLSLIGILAIILIVFIANIIMSIEKIYKEDQMFRSKSFEITVLDSYVTDKDYNGKEISNKYSYVILKIKFKNVSNITQDIIIDNTRVRVEKYITYKSTKAEYDNFIEFGVPYYSQRLKAEETREFIFVYEIEKKYAENSMKFEYLVDINSSNSEVKYDYTKVAIKPDDFSKKETKATAYLGEKVTFTDSLLSNASLTINSIELKDKYQYTYTSCIENKCSNYSKYIEPSLKSEYDLTIMRVNYNLDMSKNVDRSFNISKFIEKFGTVRYVINGKEYLNRMGMTDVTPIILPNDTYLEITTRLKQAEKVYLDITIRDKVYTYIIKDTTKVEEKAEE